MGLLQSLPVIVTNGGCVKFDTPSFLNLYYNILSALKLSIDTHYRAHIVYLLEIITDNLDIINIVYAEAYGAFEDAVIGFNKNTLHIHIEFLRDDISDLIYHTHAINSFDAQ